MTTPDINFNISEIEAKRLFVTLGAIALTADKMPADLMKVFATVGLRLSFKQFDLDDKSLMPLILKYKADLAAWDDAHRDPNAPPSAPIS